MTAGPAARTARDRFLVGDGLRAAAAITVLLYHTAQSVARYRYLGAYNPAFGAPSARVFETLNSGLFIFFSLSGYLLTRGFARSLVNGTSLPSLRSYTVSRALRIIPAFWVAVTLTLLIEGTAGADGLQLAAIYGFGQVFAPCLAAGQISQAWTLDVEMGFYIVLPLAALCLVRASRRRRTPAQRLLPLLACLVVVSVVTGAWTIATNPWSWNTLPPQLLFAFAPGIALAIVEPILAPRLGPSLARWLVPVLVSLALATFVVCCFISPAEIGIREVISTLGAGALVAAALLRQWATGGSWRLVDNRVMNWIGERSYGVYVLHMLVLAEVHKLVFRTSSGWGGWVLVTGATVSLSLVAAALSWRFVEAPALRLRGRFMPRRTIAQTTVAEQPA
jgi:peptidoglycan/LPS O-acetylase OafA/YrhL